jgi:DNA-binding NtrC family response regulator
MAFVLVVDDDADVLDSLCASLTALGYMVEAVSSGLAALDVLDDRSKEIDLLLTDVVMPGLHGFNLSRMARLRRPDLRVLYMSGFADLERILQDAGPRLGKLLQKPFRPADLRREIETALAASPGASSA